MVELTFVVEGAVVDSYAAAPSLLFKLCVANETPDVRVENVLLHCQIRIEARAEPMRRKTANVSSSSLG